MLRKIIIDGMTPESYDPFRDYTGMIEITLADEIISQAGGWDEYFPECLDRKGKGEHECRVDYELFMKLLTENNDIQIGNPFADTERKRAILKRVGYSHLIVNGGNHVRIEKVSDCAVGHVFRKAY